MSLARRVPELVDGDGRDEDRADSDQLVEGADSDDDQAAEQDDGQGGASDGADDAYPSAGEGGAADHRGGDRRERVVDVPVDRGRAEMGQVDEAGTSSKRDGLSSWYKSKRCDGGGRWQPHSMDRSTSAQV